MDDIKIDVLDADTARETRRPGGFEYQLTSRQFVYFDSLVPDLPLAVGLFNAQELPFTFGSNIVSAVWPSWIVAVLDNIQDDIATDAVMVDENEDQEIDLDVARQQVMKLIDRLKALPEGVLVDME